MKFDQVTIGEDLPGRTVTITRADLVRYAGASGDFNPIHWQERTAREVGLPGVIAHGMFTMALAVTIVTDWLGDAGAIIEYGTKFTNLLPVDDVAGAELRLGGTVAALDASARTARIDLVASLLAPDGSAQAVLGRARAVVRLS
jgi:acyl dehydratase